MGLISDDGGDAALSDVVRSSGRGRLETLPYGREWQLDHCGEADSH